MKRYLPLYLVILNEAPTGDIGYRIMAKVDQMEKDKLPEEYIHRELVRILYHGIINQKWPTR